MTNCKIMIVLLMLLGLGVIFDLGHACDKGTTISTGFSETCEGPCETTTHSMDSTTTVAPETKTTQTRDETTIESEDVTITTQTEDVTSPTETGHVTTTEPAPPSTTTDDSDEWTYYEDGYRLPKNCMKYNWDLPCGYCLYHKPYAIGRCKPFDTYCKCPKTHKCVRTGDIMGSEAFVYSCRITNDPNEKVYREDNGHFWDYDDEE